MRDYTPGQEELQIEPALGISNRGKKIINRGREFKYGQIDDFKLGQGLQIGAEQHHWEKLFPFLVPDTTKRKKTCRHGNSVFFATCLTNKR